MQRGSKEEVRVDEEEFAEHIDAWDLLKGQRPAQSSLRVQFGDRSRDRVN
jgi:hypothetical protein